MKTIDRQEQRKRLAAAQDLLNVNSTTKAKFEAIRSLIHGISPKLDKLLEISSKQIGQIEKIQSGEVIHLVAEELPEHTEEHKKRKKLLLLFIRSWKNLDSEVKRVQAEFNNVHHHKGATQSKLAAGTRLLLAAKGPLGFITIIAVAAVIVQSSAVKIAVHNEGCSPIKLLSIPLVLPGIQLPAQPINSGASAEVTMLPITLTIDGSVEGQIGVTILGISRKFDISNTELVLNDLSLSGRKTSISLGTQKQHILRVRCSH